MKYKYRGISLIVSIVLALGLFLVSYKWCISIVLGYLFTYINLYLLFKNMHKVLDNTSKVAKDTIINNIIRILIVIGFAFLFLKYYVHLNILFIGVGMVLCLFGYIVDYRKGMNL